MKLNELIEKHVMTDPEWREAFEEADATRAGARAIARARKEAGLSQAELAARAGTAQAVVSRIERGAVSPSLDTFGRLARGLGMRAVVVLEPAPPARSGGKKKVARKPTRASAAHARKSVAKRGRTSASG